MRVLTLHTPPLAGPTLRVLALLALLPFACSSSPAPPSQVGPATAAYDAGPSIADDPSLVAELRACPPPEGTGADQHCTDGCQMIAGRCRRVQGGITIPTRHDPDAGATP